MAGYSADIRGVREVTEALKQLEPKLQRKVIRQGMRKGLKVVKDIVKQNAPVESGLTKESVKIRAGKSRKGVIRLNVQIGEGDYVGQAFYASFVEYGYFHGSRDLGSARKWIPPVHFMKRSFEMGCDAATEITVNEILAGVDKVIAEGNR